ncbi:MAG TPA: NADP-dependent phosphogluconate dehydrogenase [Armatimonadota bacterium]|jgi:6-phosphogluconate dehydrogenase
MHEAYDIGMIGLGVMGSNLALNMADHGYAVLGFDMDPAKATQLRGESGSRPIGTADSLQTLIDGLRVPRVAMMLVPAGAPVDAVIRALLPLLKPGDILIDGGNSHFSDTQLRQTMLADKGIHLLGVGISGGEEGARHGPCIMPGGDPAAYAQVQPILVAVAAQVAGEPCVSYLGPGAAGHYVKMVHNGIEYGLMQLIAESYHVMKCGLGLDNDALHAVYARWNTQELSGYLLDITAEIFCHVDETTGKRLIDAIRDVAGQKGTGMWTSQDAMSLHQPIPAIDTAVAMRDLSTLDTERAQASQLLVGPAGSFDGDPTALQETLRQALYLGMLVTYAQGMALLYAASRAYNYHLPLAQVARIWRGGCIIRATLLQEVARAYGEQAELANLLLDTPLAREASARHTALRTLVSTAVTLGIPVPGFMSVLGYYDAYHSAWLPANLIQAQRDYFGAHTYERNDEKGIFHTQWD